MNAAAHVHSDPFSHRLTGRRLGRYEVLTRLASGGMASVYVARGLGVAGFERLFAIKVLHPHLAHEQEFVAMFLDEARLAARIRNPNVVSTIDISDSEDAGYYLVMDYIEGDHLGALLQSAFKRNERLPFPVSLRIMTDTLDGLTAAHDLKDEMDRPLELVHRDISPHNIMVSTDGGTRLTDFGVAKARFRLSSTRDGQFKGKLAYMAPEHASDGISDQRSDLFAAAIVLWESLTGRRLFRAENQAATLNKVCLDPIPLASSFDPALQPFDDILAKGLARSPAGRFQTAQAFAEAIESAAPALGGLASPRVIGRLVKELAADKIARDESSIRWAIADLAESAAPSAAAEPETSPPTGTPSQSIRETTDAGEIADSLEPEAMGKRSRSHNALWAAALTVGLAGGVAMATWLWGQRSPPDSAFYESAAASRVSVDAPSKNAPSENAPSENAPKVENTAIQPPPSQTTSMAPIVRDPSAPPRPPLASPPPAITAPATKPSVGPSPASKRARVRKARVANLARRRARLQRARSPALRTPGSEVDVPTPPDNIKPSSKPEPDLRNTLELELNPYR